MSKLSITNEVRSLLLSNKDITDKIGKKIYPLFAPNGTDGDFIIYARAQFSVDRNKMGADNEECYIYLNAVCSDYEDSQSLAELIYETLDGKSTSEGEITLVDSQEDVGQIKSSGDTVDNKYIQILKFSIK